ASEELLDTYEPERKQHAHYWVEQAVAAQDFLQPTDETRAAARDAFLWANPGAAAPTPPALGPGLHDAANDDRAGWLGMQPILADGIRLDDIVGSHFLVATMPDMYNRIDLNLRTV